MCSEHTDSPVNRSGKGNVPRTAPYDFAGETSETNPKGTQMGRTEESDWAREQREIDANALEIWDLEAAQLRPEGEQAMPPPRASRSRTGCRS